MAQSYKCSVCDKAASFHGREAALAAGWTLVDIATQERRKYWCICSAHAALGWLRQALGEPEKKKDTKHE